MAFDRFNRSPIDRGIGSAPAAPPSNTGWGPGGRGSAYSPDNPGGVPLPSQGNTGYGPGGLGATYSPDNPGGAGASYPQPEPGALGRQYADMNRQYGGVRAGGAADLTPGGLGDGATDLSGWRGDATGLDAGRRLFAPPMSDFSGMRGDATGLDAGRRLFAGGGAPTMRDFTNGGVGARRRGPTVAPTPGGSGISGLGFAPGGLQGLLGRLPTPASAAPTITGDPRPGGAPVGGLQGLLASPAVSQLRQSRALPGSAGWGAARGGL